MARLARLEHQVFPDQRVLLDQLAPLVYKEFVALLETLAPLALLD